MNIQKQLVSILALASGLVVASTSAPASAAEITCSPTALTTSNGFGGHVAVQCADSGTWYNIFLSRSDVGACRNTSEAYRAYISLIQAAILAGKTLSFVTESCSGEVNVINWMKLNR